MRQPIDGRRHLTGALLGALMVLPIGCVMHGPTRLFFSGHQAPFIGHGRLPQASAIVAHGSTHWSPTGRKITLNYKNTGVQPIRFGYTVDEYVARASDGRAIVLDKEFLTYPNLLNPGTEASVTLVVPDDLPVEEITHIVSTINDRQTIVMLNSEAPPEPAAPPAKADPDAPTPAPDGAQLAALDADADPQAVNDTADTPPEASAEDAPAPEPVEDPGLEKRRVSRTPVSGPSPMSMVKRSGKKARLRRMAAKNPERDTSALQAVPITPRTDAFASSGSVLLQANLPTVWVSEPPPPPPAEEPVTEALFDLAEPETPQVEEAIPESPDELEPAEEETPKEEAPEPEEEALPPPVEMVPVILEFNQSFGVRLIIGIQWDDESDVTLFRAGDRRAFAFAPGRHRLHFLCEQRPIASTRGNVPVDILPGKPVDIELEATPHMDGPEITVRIKRKRSLVSEDRFTPRSSAR